MHRTDTTAPTLQPMDAAVCEVLPKFGLAFFTDGKTRTWGATRCTLGTTLDGLAEGQRVRLYLLDRDGFSIVQRCELLQ
ncbi:MAG: hypothetical protein ABW067_08935 [Rhizobacter sp.]|jgi:hypothetical protein